MNEIRTKITSLSEQALADYITGLGQPAFRAKQIFRWLHQRAQTSFSQMTDIPKTLIARLEQEAEIECLTVARKQVSKDGTVKYLFRLPDGNCIESVVMRYHYGNTICVSSEVGCRMGCRFCASTQNGLARRLTPGEIAAQVYTAGAELGERISHIVMMGIGEPLDNYENVLGFLHLISSPNGLEHRNEKYQSFDLWPCAPDSAPSSRETWVDPFNLLACAQQSDALFDDAGQ